MNNKLKESYRENADAALSKIEKYNKLNRFYLISELTTFGLAVVAFVFYCVEGMPLWLLILTIVILGFYVLLRRGDAGNSDMIRKHEGMLKALLDEVKYHDGDYSAFDAGNQYVDAGHPYTLDMDIFGKGSLFNRICRTVTTGGSDKLASYLQTFPKDKQAIDNRKDAIYELASRPEALISHFSCRKDNAVDTDAVLDVMRNVKDMKINSGVNSNIALIVSYLAIIGFIVSIILAVFTPLSANVPLAWGCVQFFIVFTSTARPLRDISKAVNRLHKQLDTYVEQVEYMSEDKYRGAELRRIHDVLYAGDANALKSFNRLSEILKGLDRRGNLLGLFFFDMLFLSDIFLVRKFIKWQELYLDRIGEWIDAISEMDALKSMAMFRYNEEYAMEAHISNADMVIFEAKGLYHPFLGDKAVKNDFTIKNENYYIVTGANMAGKSTFLRSIGINYILAMNGLPVFADKFEVSLFSLFTSMRTTDDLTHGISYFNAELLRLKQLIGNCKQSKHTLIILDEILKGTNSLDKLNGSRLFLQEISKLPVTGVIATHDLELSKMEDEHPTLFHNYCFEIKLEDRITYSYKLTKGVARNQNATYLLKNIISEI